VGRFKDDLTIRIRIDTSGCRFFLEAIARGGQRGRFPLSSQNISRRTDPFTQITEPYRNADPTKFVKEEFAAGSFAAYMRNPDYKPAKGIPNWTSGAKSRAFRAVGMDRHARNRPPPPPRCAPGRSTGMKQVQPRSGSAN